MLMNNLIYKKKYKDSTLSRRACPKDFDVFVSVSLGQYFFPFKETKNTIMIVLSRVPRSVCDIERNS